MSGVLPLPSPEPVLVARPGALDGEGGHARRRFVTGASRRIGALRIILASVRDRPDDPSVVLAARQMVTRLLTVAAELGLASTQGVAASIDRALDVRDVAAAEAALGNLADAVMADLAGVRPEWDVPTGAPRRVVVFEPPGSTAWSSQTLRSAGYHVVETSVADTLAAEVAAVKPDALVLDLDLAGGDAMDVVRRARRDPGLKAVPILVMTAQQGVMTRMAGYATGADDYLHTPCDPGVLLLRVQRMIAGAASRPTMERAVEADETGDAMMPFEDFAVVTKLALAEGPGALALIRVPPTAIGELARLLGAELRRRDLVCQYSPSHLLVFAPATAAAACRATIEQVVEQLTSASRLKVFVGVAASETGDEAGGLDALIASADVSLAQARTQFSAESGRATVVIAEHDPDVQQVIDTRLRAEGYHTTLTFDGAATIETVERERPDVLVVAIRLPTLTGFEILSRLGDMGSARPFTIVLSATGLDDDVTRAFELGADDYLAKPFNPDELVARIARLLR